MIQTIKLLEGIKNTKGTNDKVAKLRDESRKCSARNLEILNLTLDLLYNPTSSTNIAKKKIEKEVPLEELKYSDSKEFLVWLKNECSGKDTDIAQCQAFIKSLDEEYRQTMKEIITQSFSCNLDYKLINRAYGYAFIEFYECMKAKNIKDLLDKIDENEIYSISMKLDGFKALVKVDDLGNKTAYSRNGLKYEGLDDFLSQLNLDKGMLYDGELLYFDDSLKSSERFKKTSEIVRRKGKKNKDLLVYEIYDCIPLKEYSSGKSSLVYSKRREYLDTLPQNKYQKITKVLKQCKIDSELFNYLDEVISQGNEGLMANKLDSYYEVGKRTCSIIKFKQQNDVDLRVIGVEEGTGKYKGMVGSLVVEYLGNEVKVGSGLSDSFRKEIWNNKDNIIGKIIEIQYMEITQDKDRNYSLRHPRFKRIRDDKMEVSYD